MKKLLLSMFCILLLLSVSFAGAEEELVIVHATDTHYFSPALTDYGEGFMELIENADGKVTHYTPQIMAAFTDEMLALQPNAVVLSGDLTFNGAPQSHTDLAALLKPLTQAGIQVLALPGNHDTNTTAYKFEEPAVHYLSGLADEDFDDVYSSFGYATALSRDPASMSYVAGISPRVWCLMVDANANGFSGKVSDDTFLWIEQQLIKAQREDITVIAVTHQPALIHNSLFTFGYVIHNHTALLSLYEKYGVTLNLSGHLHMQHIERSNGLTEVAASSLAVSPNQYGVLRIKDGKLSEYRMQPLNVSAWAKKTGQTNPDLLDFAAYASNFFNQSTYRQAASMMMLSTLDLEEQEEMIDFAVCLNAEYFSGKRSIPSDDPLWLQWQQHLPASFFTYYMNSILSEPPQDMCAVSFESGAP